MHSDRSDRQEHRQTVLRAAAGFVLFGIVVLGCALNSMRYGSEPFDGNLTPALIALTLLLVVGGWGRRQLRQLRQLPDGERYLRTPSWATREKCLLWGFWVIVFAGDVLAERFPGGISTLAVLVLGLYVIWAGVAVALHLREPQQSPDDGGLAQRVG